MRSGSFACSPTRRRPSGWPPGRRRTPSGGVPVPVVVGDRPIGRIGLNGLRRRDRVASLYLYIGEPEFWGHGYARDAVTPLLAYAFDRFALHLVELWTLGDNARAVAAY